MTMTAERPLTECDHCRACDTRQKFICRYCGRLACPACEGGCRPRPAKEPER